MKTTRAGKARVRLVASHPFFASIALGLRIKEADETDVKSVATDGRRIVINRAWSEDEATDIDDVVAEIAAATLHVGLGHPARRDVRDRDRWNEACARAIGPIMNEAFRGNVTYRDFREDRTAEQWFALLEEQQEQPPSSCGGQGDGSGAQQQGEDGQDGQGQNSGSEGQSQDQQQGQGQGQGQGGGQGSSQAQGRSRESGSGGRCQVLDMPVGADARHERQDGQQRMISASVAAQGRGTLPGFIQQLLQQIRSPRRSARDLFREYLLSVVSADSSWRRLNRRFLVYGLCLPSTRTPSLGEIAVLIDTSASMSDETLERGFGWLESVISEVLPERVHVGQFDAQMQNFQTLERWERPRVEVCGRGGTAFQPALDDLRRRGITPSVCIFVTDLMGDEPKNPGFPVIWMYTRQGCNYPMDALLSRIPWGAKVSLDEYV